MHRKSLTGEAKLNRDKAMPPNVLYDRYYGGYTERN